MSGTQDTPYDLPPAGDGPAGAEETRAPRRVIGTPSPAQQHLLLADREEEEAPPPAPRELPADPEDPVKAKRAERLVGACFIIATLAGFGFIVAYIGIGVHGINTTLRSNLALGTTLSVSMLGLAVGATIWVRHLMPQVELTEPRKPLASAEKDRQEFAETWVENTEASQFVKRPIVRRTLIAATLPLALAPVVLLRDMGPMPGTSLRHTVWRKGMRLLVYGPNTPILAADFSSPGGMITVVPDGYQQDLNALAKATTIIIKFAPGELQPPTVMNWTVENIVAYSKICTHVGCPAALYEETTHHILCPCHQSTFDAPRGATVLFGPAARPLPQLPITTDSQGYLVAQGDFNEPVGPSFWERG